MTKPIKTIISLVVSLSLGACATSNFELERGKQSFLRQDYRQAFIRLMPSAKNDNADAQYAVAYMYYYGQGTVEDKQKASYWMKKSASNGNLDAVKALRLLKLTAPQITNHQ